jgi:hypothetical protein
MAETPQPWEAPDGTRWLWFPQFGEWHGWIPGEDGLWILTPEEFRDSHPEWHDEHIEG